MSEDVDAEMAGISLLNNDDALQVTLGSIILRPMFPAAKFVPEAVSVSIMQGQSKYAFYHGKSLS